MLLLLAFAKRGLLRHRRGGGGEAAASTSRMPTTGKGRSGTSMTPTTRMVSMSRMTRGKTIGDSREEHELQRSTIFQKGHHDRINEKMKALQQLISRYNKHNQGMTEPGISKGINTKTSKLG